MEREVFTGFNSGGPSIATLAASTWLKEELFSAGIGFNIYSGSRYDSTSLLVDGEIFQFQVSPVPILVTVRRIDDFSEVRNYSGTNATVGAMLYGDQYSIGAVVRTPFTMTISHDTRIAQADFERTLDSVLERDQFSVLYITDTEIDLPMQIGIGVSYRPQQNLTLAMDYEFTGYSSAKFRSQADILDPRSDFVEGELTWKDTHQIRLGLEYKIDLGWGSLPIRAGFRIDPLPYSHLTEIRATLFGEDQFIEDDQIVGEVYALGAGIEWNQIRLDLTWEYSTLSTFNDGYFQDSFLRPQFIYEQAVSNQRLLIGFTGYF